MYGDVQGVVRYCSPALIPAKNSSWRPSVRSASKRVSIKFTKTFVELMETPKISTYTH